MSTWSTNVCSRPWLQEFLTSVMFFCPASAFGKTHLKSTFDAGNRLVFTLDTSADERICEIRIHGAIFTEMPPSLDLSRYVLGYSIPKKTVAFLQSKKAKHPVAEQFGSGHYLAADPVTCKSLEKKSLKFATIVYEAKGRAPAGKLSRSIKASTTGKMEVNWLGASLQFDVSQKTPTDLRIEITPTTKGETYFKNTLGIKIREYVKLEGSNPDYFICTDRRGFDDRLIINFDLKKDARQGCRSGVLVEHPPAIGGLNVNIYEPDVKKTPIEVILPPVK